VPSTDGEADPGEVVWTWVPFEEQDGRGKDRPVVVVAAEVGGTVLAVALTSQEHPGRPEYVAVGAGAWDGKRRPSFARVDRVYRLHPGGMRREAAALDRAAFDAVREALRQRYGWR
jgi:mRNA-degrading endonuclease toxin of MazEF toxin-antitoxin module